MKTLFILCFSCIFLVACGKQYEAPERELQNSVFKGDMRYANTAVEKSSQIKADTTLIVGRSFALMRDVLITFNGIPIPAATPTEIPAALVLSKIDEPSYNVLISGPHYETHAVKPGVYYISLLKFYSYDKMVHSQVLSIMRGVENPEKETPEAKKEQHQCFLGALTVHKGEAVYIGDIVMTRPPVWMGETVVYTTMRDNMAEVEQEAILGNEKRLTKRLLDMPCTDGMEKKQALPPVRARR